MSSTTTAPQQTATQTASSGAFGSFPIANQTYPEEGSRVISLQYNWTSVTGYSDDLSQLVALGVETTIQTAYIDNSSNAQSVTITIPATGQVLTCPALNQGFFPLMFTGTPQFQVTVAATAANAVTRIALLNVPISQGPWAASGTALSGTPVPPVSPGAFAAGVQGGLAMGVTTLSPNPGADSSINPLSLNGGSALRVQLANTNGVNMAYADLQTYPGFSTTVSGVFKSAPALVGTNSTVTPLITDPYSSLYVNMEQNQPTYSAGAVFTSAATPTDCFTIYGSATKTVRVHEITVNGTDASGGGIFLCEVVKRGSAPTGGTSSAVTAVAHDSNSAAATATVQSFTVNPTSVGALVGLVEATAVGITPNSNSPNFPFKYGPGAGDQSIVLRGTAQGLAVNFLGASIGTGTQLAIRVKWSEV